MIPGQSSPQSSGTKLDHEARARLAATALVKAAGTERWATVEPEIVSWFGRGRPARKIGRRLAVTRKWVLAAGARGAAQDVRAAREAAQVRAAEAREWDKRFADVLAAHPDAAGELDLLVEDLQACLPEPAPPDGTGGWPTVSLGPPGRISAAP